MIANRKWVSWLTILSGLTGLLSYTLVAGAVNFNFDFFSDATLIFSTEGVSSSMLKWSMITDIFGYYLLLLPVLFFLHEWLNGKSEWRNVFTFCGGAYIFAGAVGAAILGAAWPALLDKFPSATPEQQEMIKASFEMLALIVVHGIWNSFDALMFSVWFISIGIFIKGAHVFWGWVTIIIGLLSAVDFSANIFGLKTLADMALNLYLVLAPLWAIGIGTAMLKRKILN